MEQQPNGVIPPSPQPPQTPGVIYPGGMPPPPTPIAPVPTQGMPPSAQPDPKHNKKLIFLAVGLIVFVLLIVAVALLIPKNKSSNSKKLSDITRTYDSPMGILPAFQDQEIKSGTFKLSASYVTGANFTREGKFFVDEKGQMSFELLPDEAKVNELLKTLLAKNGGELAEEDSATRNVSFSFDTLLGYDKLTDPSRPTYGSLLTLVAEAKEDPETAAAMIKTGQNCDAALEEAQEKLGSTITTTSLSFDRKQDGIKTKASITHPSLQTTDKAALTFLDTCFDFSKAEEGTDYKPYVDGLRENTTKSPEFSYWQEGDKYLFEIAIPGDKSELSSNLRFELSGLTGTTAKQTGTTRSFRDMRNLFGLAYSICRVPPVVTLPDGEDFSFEFIVESEAYHYPDETDAGYYCSTLTLPTQYQTPTELGLNFTTGAKITVPEADVANVRAFHDLGQLIEKFFVANKRYPNQSEFKDLLGNNLGQLSVAAQTLVQNKVVTYTNLPGSCINNCMDYTFVYNFKQQAQLIQRAYK